MVADTVLLPKVFPTNLVSLGQLVRNPLLPNANTYRDGCVSVLPDDISTSDPEAPYSALISTDTHGRFDVGLTQYLGTIFWGQKTSLLSVDAEKLQLSTLNDTEKVFRRICESDGAKKWIMNMVLNKAPCYLVIGLQVIHKAKFTRARLSEGGGGGYVKLPLEATQTLPVHIEGHLNASAFGNSVGQGVTGVFGIQVQKLHSRIGPTGEPSLNTDIFWKWTHQIVKGSLQKDEKRLNLWLGDAKLDELVNLLKSEEEEDADADDE